jgi:hypothetical protein
MLFAMQLLVPRDDATWLPLAWSILRDAPQNTHPEELAGTFRALCDLIRAALPDVHYGLWDYIAEAEDAEEEYQQWCEGTAVDIDEELEFQDADETTYAFVTILLLMEDGGAAQSRIWAESERIPEGEEATIKAYGRFLDVIGQLDFATIQSCALFVRPGDGGCGVMESMLREEHYHYLVPVL